LIDEALMADQTTTPENETAEQDAALEELLGGGDTSSDESAQEEAPAENTSKDDEAAAPEELMAEETPEADGVKDDEAAALDELMGGEDAGADETTEKETPAVDQSEDQGIITLDEVVSLGGVSAEAAQSEEDSGAQELAGAEETPAETPDETPSAADSTKPDKSTPAKKAPEESHGGLSDGEKDDLEKLIKGLKEDQPDAAPQPVVEDLQKQLKVMRKRIIQLGTLVQQYDRNMKSYSKIMRLYFQKSDVMNKRIDAMEASNKGSDKA
jgi:hypothetical protein